MGLISFFSLFLLLAFSFASIQKLTNPILPVKLNNAKIISSKHTFVIYLNHSDLQVMQNYLKEQVNFIADKKNCSEQASKLIIQAHALLENNDHLLQTIIPSLRQKRGLINLGGKVSKWLFGTLDTEDGERIDKILEFLRKNDNLLQDKINDQIHLAKEIIMSSNQSFSHLKTSILENRKILYTLQESINEINALGLIINSLNTLTIKLTQIVNAITFANLHKIHPVFLSIESLQFLIKKMNLLYPKNQLVHFSNQHSYYEYLGIQPIYENEKIIFLIHFPVLKPDIFTTYFLYPVLIQNKIILSPKPYLYLNEKNGQHQYGPELCEKIEATYYCNNHLQTQDDCMVNIILYNEPNNCTALAVHLEEAIANQVTPDNILFTTPRDIIVTETCSVETHHEVKPGSYLVTISDKCSIQINKEKFFHEETTIPNARLIQLPSLNLSVIPEYSTKMKLKNIDLDSIQYLTTKINSQHELLLPSNVEMNTAIPTWLLILICVLICAICYVGISCYYRVCYPYPMMSLLMKKRNSSAPPEDSQPSQPIQP